MQLLVLLGLQISRQFLLCVWQWSERQMSGMYASGCCMYLQMGHSGLSVRVVVLLRLLISNVLINSSKDWVWVWNTDVHTNINRYLEIQRKLFVCFVTKNVSSTFNSMRKRYQGLCTERTTPDTDAERACWQRPSSFLEPSAQAHRPLRFTTVLKGCRTSDFSF